MKEKLVKTKNKKNADTLRLSDNDLHKQVNKQLWEADHIVFQLLPSLINQIIEYKIWKKRNKSYKHFGEYALDQSSEGLGIKNNQMLWLLRCSMDIHGKHAVEWGDVLSEVDQRARMYAKENNLPLKQLDGSLKGFSDSHSDLSAENVITYLPSRSRSNDGQLLKLKRQDKQTYQKVIHGKMALKEAFPRKKKNALRPVESVKDRFNKLSKADRETFLAWLGEQGA